MKHGALTDCRVRDFHRFVVRGNTCKRPSPSPLFLNSDCLRYVQRGGRIDGQKLNRSIRELSKSAHILRICGELANRMNVKRGWKGELDRCVWKWSNARSSVILYFITELLIDKYIIFRIDRLLSLQPSILIYCYWQNLDRCKGFLLFYMNSSYFQNLK